MESPHLARLIDGTEFDTVCHEHVFYCSLTAFDDLLRRYELAVTGVERLRLRLRLHGSRKHGIGIPPHPACLTRVSPLDSRSHSQDAGDRLPRPAGRAVGLHAVTHRPDLLAGVAVHKNGEIGQYVQAPPSTAPRKQRAASDTSPASSGGAAQEPVRLRSIPDAFRSDAPTSDGAASSSAGF
ncbi:hypothetical protein ABZ858_23080 [Streptomyces sp. NPDC047017]|uniref:hypothetical protein n=1 Tax=Streptomyces sp. NPDC047017 TaxID=3155024 RepID=UPI0034048B07